MKFLTLRIAILLTLTVLIFDKEVRAQGFPASQTDKDVIQKIQQDLGQETGSPTAQPIIVYMDSKRSEPLYNGRHLVRYNKEDLTRTFIPKGTFMGGMSSAFNEWQGENDNYLILKNVDFKGHTFSISPSAGYFIADNVAVGLRFGYNRNYFNLGNLDLDLGEDFKISLEDLYYLEHSHKYSGFVRYYMPLAGSRIFGMYSEMRLTYGDVVGKNTTGAGAELDGTFHRDGFVQMSFCPGLVAFITNSVALEIGVDVFGIKYRWSSQSTNQIESGYMDSGSAALKVNLLSVNIGMCIYL